MMDIFTVTQRVYLIHTHIHRISLISVVDLVEKQMRHVPLCHGITSNLQSLSHKRNYQWPETLLLRKERS